MVLGPKGRWDLFRIVVVLETCSTYEHPPADRHAVMGMLAEVQPGDIVLLASPDRVARKLEHLQQCLDFLARRGVLVCVAAVGPHAARPLAVVAAGTQLGSGGQAEPEPEAAQERQAAVSALQQAVLSSSAAAWALSVGHGSYTADHAFMQRLQGCPLPAGHPVRSLLERLGTDGADWAYFCRISDEVWSGSAQAGAGAAARGSLTNGSLQRQQGCIASLFG